MTMTDETNEPRSAEQEAVDQLVEAGLLDRDGVGAASAPGHAEAGS